MNDAYREWILARYDRHVSQQVEGVELGSARERVAKDFLIALDLGQVPSWTPDQATAMALFDKAVMPERDRRRASFKKNAEYLLDALRNPDDGVHVEPFLDTVYPLGSAKGRDKAFRYWTEDDLIASTIERYRNAAAAMQAAKEHDEVTSDLLDVLRVRGARMVGDCFEQVAA